VYLFVCVCVILCGWDLKGKASSLLQQSGTAHKARSHAHINTVSTSDTSEALYVLKHVLKIGVHQSSLLPIDRKLHGVRAAPFLCFLQHVYVDTCWLSKHVFNEDSSLLISEILCLYCHVLLPLLWLKGGCVECLWILLSPLLYWIYLLLSTQQAICYNGFTTTCFDSHESSSGYVQNLSVLAVILLTVSCSGGCWSVWSGGWPYTDMNGKLKHI
jgi:hypothetical protein